jgi:hypothetical protein
MPISADTLGPAVVPGERLNRGFFNRVEKLMQSPLMRDTIPNLIGPLPDSIYVEGRNKRMPGMADAQIGGGTPHDMDRSVMQLFPAAERAEEGVAGVIIHELGHELRKRALQHWATQPDGSDIFNSGNSLADLQAQVNFRFDEMLAAQKRTRNPKTAYAASDPAEHFAEALLFSFMILRRSNYNADAALKTAADFDSELPGVLDIMRYLNR